MQDLNIALIQTRLEWEDKKANLRNFGEKLRSISSETQLVVLPEMFSTGFSMRPEKLAEDMDGPTVQWMKEQASRQNITLTGSIIIGKDGKYFNRLIWMRPDGSFETYDKRHLFSMAKEEAHYTAGDQKLIVELNGWKICPMVCYDLRFPVWIRNTELYDCLIFVANWPERRANHWELLLQARAIENQCFVAGVNRVGTDGNEVEYDGRSAIYSPTGDCLAQMKHQQGIIYAQLEKTSITKVRRYMPFLQDRDTFDIELEK
ncbi:MAG: amidohydrolase [Bacteroidia bacterium]